MYSDFAGHTYEKQYGSGSNQLFILFFQVVNSILVKIYYFRNNKVVHKVNCCQYKVDMVWSSWKYALLKHNIFIFHDLVHHAPSVNNDAIKANLDIVEEQASLLI